MSVAKALANLAKSFELENLGGTIKLYMEPDMLRRVQSDFGVPHNPLGVTKISFGNVTIEFGLD